MAVRLQLETSSGSRHSDSLTFNEDDEIIESNQMMIEKDNHTTKDLSR